MKYKLSDICSGITDGSHNPPAGISKSDYLMLSSKNIFDDDITLEDPRYLSKEQYVVEHKRTGIKPGDILMTIVGTVGRTAIVPEGIPPITLQRSVAVLHPLKDVCLSRYLMYVLRSNRKVFESEAHGVAQKGIYLKQLSSIVVEVPEIKKQEKVVHILDQVQSVIKWRQEELIKLNNLIKARFVEMFGDLFFSDAKHYTVPEVAYVYIGLVTTMTKHYVSEGTPLIFNSTVKDNYFEFKERVYLDEEFAIANAHRKHKIGDVITVHTGDVGTSAIIGPDLEGSLGFATIVSRINDISFLRPAYLCDFFNSELCKHQLKNMIRGDRNNLNLKEFNQILFTVPPIEKQMEWEEYRKQVDKSKAQVQKALDETQLLFNSLMQEFFG